MEIRAVGKVARDPQLYQAIVEYREALRARGQIKDSPWLEAHEGAQAIVRGTVAKYPRLRELKVYTLDEKGEPRLVASKNEKEVGTAGGKNEKDTITQGHIYYGKDKKSVSVVMPLRDHNGEPMAAVRLAMESFAGQTEQNALVRAMPIVKGMQARVRTLEELTQ